MCVEHSYSHTSIHPYIIWFEVLRTHAAPNNNQPFRCTATTTLSSIDKFCVWQFCTLRFTIRSFAIGFTSVSAIDHNPINWLINLLSSLARERVHNPNQLFGRFIRPRRCHHSIPHEIDSGKILFSFGCVYVSRFDDIGCNIFSHKRNQ